MRLSVIGAYPWRVVYRPTHRSREPAANYPCALAGWGAYCTTNVDPPSRAVNVMVWDHCHQHGYIRGPLCAYHNGRMAQFDRRRARWLYDPDLIDYARRCSGCAPPW